MKEQYEAIKLRAQAAVLRDLMREYSGRTIDNILQNLESRIKAKETWKG